MVMTGMMKGTMQPSFRRRRHKSLEWVESGSGGLFLALAIVAKSFCVIEKRELC